MKKGIVLFLVLSVLVLSAPLVQASDYIGDYCWDFDGTTLAFSVSFLGVDSRGYESYNYAGRMITASGALPVNGNCIEIYVSGQRRYQCNMLLTGPNGAATFFADFDFYSLEGTGDANFDVWDGVSFQRAHYTNRPLLPIACPAC
jgi:hypothetical protein